MMPEVHVVVIWRRGLGRAGEILADLRSRFRILDVFRVEWSADRFASCLIRFYEDSTMRSRSRKERHIGAGPFLLVVVEDERPEYGPRTTSRGLAEVHTTMFDAKARYRRLTGGGHRVHGSVTAAEADRDLYFVLGRRSASFGGEEDWDGVVQPCAKDVIGVSGWRDREQLLTDLELSLPYVLLGDGPPLTVLVEERWWAEVVGAVHNQRRGAARLTIPVGGANIEMVVGHVGDGSLDQGRQRAILASRVRDESGVFLPADAAERVAALEGLLRGGALEAVSHGAGPAVPGWRKLIARLRR